MNFLQHGKHQLTLTGKVVVIRFIIFFTVFAIFQQVNAQDKPERKAPPKDSAEFIKKGVKPALKDTTKAKADSAKAKKGDIESTIVYSADDSIISELSTKIVRLYGNAKVTYGQIKLDAEEIIIDYEKSTITANGKRDSTGKLVGFPVFKDGNETYETKGMVYNFKTKKASITEVVTKQGEQIMHGQKVYKNDKNEIFTINNGFTTCDLADPHYRIVSKKAKAITGDKMISGPFYMEFNHVPTPLGFAFGMFPSQRQSQSGVIVPAYGEEQTRGFFLRRGGYYFHVNDYFDLTLTADLYAKGSTALYLNSNYISRYKYSGTVAFSFSNNNYSTSIEKPDIRKDFSLTWSHAPRSKGTARFAASVNAATSTNNTNNLLGMGQTNLAMIQNSNMQRKASSNISFSKTFPGTPLSLAMNMRHSQDFSTRRVDLSLPDLSLNLNNIYPFKKAQARILQNLQFKYTMNGTNQINNDLGLIAKNADGSLRDSIGAFNTQNLSTYFQNASKGVRHQIPLSTSFKVLKFFTLTASASYNELWYFDRIVWGTSPANNLTLGTQAIKLSTVHQFSRESFYSLSMGFTSRIYGTYLAKRPTARIRAIRHLITPNVSFSYSPDFSDPKYGYYQKIGLTDGNGKPFTVLKSIHEGYIYGTAPSGRSESMSIGLGNTLEMKVRKPKDTVDRKVSLLNNLSLGTSYNFLADSFKLAPISVTANSNILDNKININMGATLDPYQYRNGRTGIDAHDQPIYTPVRVSRYAWDAGQIGRVTSANLAFSTNLNQKGQKKDAENRDKIGKSNATQADKDFLMKHPDMYVDFTIPWNLRLSYNIAYGRTTGPASITQSANFSGDVSLSEKWKISYSAGYDFVQRQITMTTFTLSRDLHCWQMNLSWIPFGKFQSYTFNIGIKSSLLRDLKLNRTRSFTDSQNGY
ncbi:MAG TPA: putative LPS assembly protein LptD [Cyclobacteriaceae bacterium]|nr:putative LPS assembly protein LptD [Cyclobacteriaceae bacterium]